MLVLKSEICCHNRKTEEVKLSTIPIAICDNTGISRTIDEHDFENILAFNTFI